MDPQGFSRRLSAQTSRSTTGSNTSSIRLRSPTGIKLREKVLPKTANPYAFHLPRFLPECDLNTILTIETVKEVMEMVYTNSKLEKELFDPEQQIWGAHRDSKRLKILATLVLIEEPTYIINFVDNDIWDDKLPLDPASHPMLFDGWLDGHIESFCHRQYWVLAPVLDFTTTKHRVFDERFPMPFEEVLDWSQAKGGANGLVLKVKIHEKYQRWAPFSKPHSFYAIKRFDKSQRDHFLNEKEALLRFSLPEDRHNNLIRLLFSYDIGSHMFMIFPGANWDLEGFWKDNRNNPASSEELIWLIHQCLGLADGLCKVHDYGGRHGDIKSRNLLFFADPQNRPGRLVVADFTLMRFHSPDSDFTKASKVDKTTTYRPPEADGLYSTVASPKFDIWTLGCVYLEFVTWHLLGGDAITEGSFQAEDGETYESFSTARQSDDDGLAHREDKFFNQFATNAAKVKASVETWIHCLRGHPNTSPALRGLLDLVKDHMLVVVPDDRCGMHMVKETLNIIFNQCCKHAEYAEPDSERSTKGAVIAPRWTEKSKTYSRVAVGAMSTSPEPRDSGSKLDLETINQAFSDAIPFPQNQPTHQQVGVSNGLLSPPVMGSALGRNTPSLRSLRTVSSETSRASLPRDGSNVKCIPPEQLPKLVQNNAIPTSSHSTRGEGTEQNDAGFIVNISDTQRLDNQKAGQRAKTRQNLGEECNRKSQIDGRKSYDAIEKLPSWRKRLVSPVRRRYQTLKDRVHATFQRISDS